MPVPEQRDPEVTRKVLTDWLREKMPDAEDLRVENLTTPGLTGFSSETVLFDLVWTDADGEHTDGLVLRGAPAGYEIFPEYDIEMQYRILEKLGKHTDVPVPVTRGFEPDSSLLGTPFYLMEQVIGRIPPDNPTYAMDGWVLTDASPEERAGMWWSGIESLAALHRVDWKGLGLEFVDRSEFGPPGLDQQLAYQRHYLEWASRGKPQPVCEAALAWISGHRPADEQPLAFSWGDARIGNMIFEEGTGRCLAVLDWEMASIASPELDLGWFLALHRHHTEGVECPVPEGFPTREETIARYAELVGFTPRNVEFYEVFALYRFAVIMMRVAQMLMDYELMPPGADMETNNTATQLLAKTLGLPAPV